MPEYRIKTRKRIVREDKQEYVIPSQSRVVSGPRRPLPSRRTRVKRIG